MTLFEDLQSKPNVFRGRSWTPLLDFGGAQRKRVDEFLQASFRFEKTRYIGRIAISRCNRTRISRFESFEITPESGELLDAMIQNVLELLAGIPIFFERMAIRLSRAIDRNRFFGEMLIYPQDQFH